MDDNTHLSNPQIDWSHAEECSRAICDLSGLERSIDWKQGLAIAPGVPLQMFSWNRNITASLYPVPDLLIGSLIFRPCFILPD